MITLYLLFAVLLHPVHETVSELDWNAETHRLEVAIRLHSLDEQWIRRQADREAELSDVALAYVTTHLRVAATREAVESEVKIKRDQSVMGAANTVHWIGREEDGSHVWWYVEIEPRDAKEPSFLRSTLLFDHERTYVNRVVILSRVPKFAKTLTIGRPTLDLRPAANQDEPPTNEAPDRRSDLDR